MALRACGQGSAFGLHSPHVQEAGALLTPSTQTKVMPTWIPPVLPVPTIKEHVYGPSLAHRERLGTLSSCRTHNQDREKSRTRPSYQEAIQEGTEASPEVLSRSRWGEGVSLAEEGLVGRHCAGRNSFALVWGEKRSHFRAEEASAARTGTELVAGARVKGNCWEPKQT